MRTYQDFDRKTWAHVEQAIAKSDAWSIGLPKSVIEALDLHVKSFLFEQLGRASRIPFLELALSKDRKFMTALENIEKGI